MELKVLPVGSVSEAVREPFILSGYRPVGLTVLSCVKSIFRTDTNEFANFWTHFVPFLIFLFWLLRCGVDFGDEFHLPLLCFWASSLCYTFLSCFAHLFNAISYKFRHFCFFLDYSGIALHEMGGIIASFYYYRPLNRTLFQHEYAYLCLGGLITLSIVPVTCLSRFYWRKSRFLIRGLAYLPSFLWANSHIYINYLFPDGSHAFVFKQLYLHIATIVFSLLLFFFFASKVPERFAPGKFDLIGGSHQLAHISAVSVTTTQLYGMLNDIVTRRSDLLMQEIRPTFYTTVGLFVFSIFWMFGTSLFMFMLVYKDRLVDENIKKD